MITVRRAFPLPLSERSAMNVGVQKAFTDPMGTILYYAANGDWTHGKHLSKISRLLSAFESTPAIMHRRNLPQSKLVNTNTSQAAKCSIFLSNIRRYGPIS
ncbi:hypothetical protein ACHAWO_007181 [Cyclotella atomus]|uniref:Uncharacterized protein n=1 Tax=Cyclotella atomus TaxID=382360 RepID=A0ABD3N8J2_9STRA